MDNRSYSIWLVCENGHEHTTPLRAFTLKTKAANFAEARSKVRTSDEFGLPISYSISLLALFVHDGCHALNESIIREGGKKS